MTMTYEQLNVVDIRNNVVGVCVNIYIYIYIYI